MREIAKDHFLGRKDGRRLNCAQSIAETFRDRFPLGEKKSALLSACGGGMAPEGLCGAFYAAKCILEHYCPQHLGKGLEQMKEAAGSLKCKEVKTLKKLPCHECVGKAAEIIQGFNESPSPPKPF